MTDYVITVKVKIADSELGERGIGDAVQAQLEGTEFGRQMWKLGTYMDAEVTKVRATHERA